MKRLIIIFCLVTFLAGCKEQKFSTPQEIADPKLDRDLSELLAGQNKGRFQIVTAQKNDSHLVIIKLDTATGKAWTFEETRLKNTNIDNAIRASGWEPIPESYTGDIKKWIEWKP